MHDSEEIINQTKKWIKDIVIGCNFCPFAASVIRQDSVFYHVEGSSSPVRCLNTFSGELARLDNDKSIETGFLIFPNAVSSFTEYLDLLDKAEALLKRKGYNGIYQLASFHPLYCFAGSNDDDAANYTNRSIYPMLHLLRESSIDNALEHYKNPNDIPERNIKFAREKGLLYMKMLRDACF